MVARAVRVRARCRAVAAPLAAALLGIALVHLVPPPLAITWSFAHLYRHPALPVGGAVLAVPGIAVAATRWRERWHPAVAFLVVILVPYLAYAVTMDPLWGAFADWDLFGFQVAATALLARWAFVVWGRDCPRAFGVLLGLASAEAGVRLLARWNAMHVDQQAHVIESPFHVPGPKDSPSSWPRLAVRACFAFRTCPRVLLYGTPWLHLTPPAPPAPSDDPFNRSVQAQSCAGSRLIDDLAEARCGAVLVEAADCTSR